jgi:urease accessory protein
MKTAVRLSALPLLLLATPALAHPGHGGATLAAGLLHPFSGLDHMLAMTAVGLLAAKRGGVALVAWPAAFVVAMLGGYGLGLAAPGASLVEPGVLASVIVLGALAAAARQTPLFAGLALIAAFGACHGYAHGGEAPAGAGAAFPVGFAVSTAALHALGLGAGLGLRRLRQPALLRLLGAGVAFGGVALALAGSAA